MYFFFFFNDTATTEIYTLSLHDALPILYKNSEVYSLLGMKDEAIMYIKKEIGKRRRPYLFYHNLQNNHFYNSLRDDARFEKIVAEEKRLYEEHLAKYSDN